MIAAEIILWLALLYLACGLVFAAAFVTRGIDRVDPAARRTARSFRLILVPGSAALWPLLAIRWIRTAREGEHP